MINKIQFLSKTIDRLYQKRRESGLTRYAVLGVLVLCLFYILNGSQELSSFGEDAIAYIYVWGAILIFLFSITFDSHIGLENDEHQFYSKLEVNLIRPVLNGAFGVSVVLFGLGAYLFRTNELSDTGSVLPYMGLVTMASFGFIALSFREINRKIINGFNRELPLKDILYVGLLLRRRSRPVLRIRYYGVIFGACIIALVGVFVYDEKLEIRVDLLKISLPYALALVGFMLSSFQFLMAQKLSVQIQNLQRIESSIILDDKLTDDDKGGLIDRLLYVPNTQDWIKYNVDQLRKRSRYLDEISDKKLMGLLVPVLGMGGAKDLKKANERLNWVGGLNWIDDELLEEINSLIPEVDKVVDKYRKRFEKNSDTLEQE